jgi:hypothetical protein
MPIVLAIPAIILAAEAAAELTLLVTSAVLAAAVVHEASKSMTDSEADVVKPCPKQRQPCPACNPPVGTLLYEIHRVPPSAPHFPCPGDHVHWFRQMQNPNNCQCFLKRNALPVTCLPQGGQPSLPPGAIPLP